MKTIFELHEEEMELEKLYKEWLRITEEDIEQGMGGSTDCGEYWVREDFSKFAELEKEITFEEMSILEKGY